MGLIGMTYFVWLLYRGLRTGVIEGSKNGTSVRKSQHPVSFRITAWGYGVLIVMMFGLVVMAVFGLQLR
jgi:hypothetical protein